MIYFRLQSVPTRCKTFCNVLKEAKLVARILEGRSWQAEAPCHPREAANVRLPIAMSATFAIAVEFGLRYQYCEWRT